MSFELIDGGAVPIKAWTRGVPVEEVAREQLRAAASLPFVWPHLAVMPDVHWGIGSTVGSVIPTRGAIVPAAVGVDIGCGMIAIRTDLTSAALDDDACVVFEAIGAAVPHGRTDNGGANDAGSWRGKAPDGVIGAWSLMAREYENVCRDMGRDPDGRPVNQLGTLGTGNHFVEVCLDEADRVWLMLHSGSRGVGNNIGSHFITLAKRRCEREGIALPSLDLAWLPEGTPEFDDYVFAVNWAQRYASVNRQVMMDRALDALERATKTFVTSGFAVHCHHNYVKREEHFGAQLWITRKGAVDASEGLMGIIPGSMGTRSFIVRGKGNPESFHTCSHGAGRVMSRNDAKKAITLEQHVADTAGVVCRKDDGVVDESPRAYKDVEAVMAAQADLVDVVHTLKQVVCVKG